ncbi:MAG: DUF2065 family protein [Pseudomonadota bacterium]
MWQDILTAVSLYLIIEGMIPFINPDGFRRAASMISQFGDNNLRMIGLVTMGAGLLLLFLVRG